MNSKKSLFLKLFVLLPLIMLFSCGRHKVIVNNLTEREANEILVFLATRDIPAIKVLADSGPGAAGDREMLWNIQVSEMDSVHAMAILNQAGLPRHRGQTLLTIFKDSGLVPSELQERIRYQQGLAEQIASTIRRMDGILDADVNISFPEEDPLQPAATRDKKITASVYVKHSGILDDPNSHLIGKIRRFVTSSVTGLNYDDVTVIPDRARFVDVGHLRTGGREQQRELTRIWTLNVDAQSVTRFRVLFFTFILLVLFLFSALIFIFWKIYPILKEKGGASAIFSISSKGEKDQDDDETSEDEEGSGKNEKDKEGKKRKEEQKKPSQDKASETKSTEDIGTLDDEDS